MVSHRAINDIIRTTKNEVHFFFFSVCCNVFNCSWQLITYDKNQKSCVKCLFLVTDHGLYDQKAFYKVKLLFIQPLWMMVNSLIIGSSDNETTIQNTGEIRKKWKRKRFFADSHPIHSPYSCKQKCIKNIDPEKEKQSTDNTVH